MTRPPLEQGGEPQVLATDDCDEGARQLVCQHIRGPVVLSDTPSGEERGI